MGRIGQIAWNKGLKGAQVAWNKGVSPSAESKKKMSESAKRRLPMTEETREKIRIASKGRIFTVETRKKLSVARIGIKISEETRKRMSQASKSRGNGRLGYRYSKELKEKLRIAHLGQVSWNKGLTKETDERLLKVSGENNSNWKGGITPENHKIRNSSLFIKWAKDIKERDDYTCQICGERGGKLRSNHIKRFVDFPELRLEPNNGITICTRCDYAWVFYREQEWESYFNFNLEARTVI